MTISDVLDATMIVTLRVDDLREVVRAAVAEALAVKSRDDLLDMRQVADRYGIGRNAVKAAAKRRASSETGAAEEVGESVLRVRGSLVATVRRIGFRFERFPLAPSKK